MKKDIRQVQSDGVVVEYSVEGEGPPIVVLPSLGRGPADYDVLTALLVQEGFSVVRPQPRGLAGSQGPMENLTLHDLAADVARVVRAEGIPDAVLAGHALGNFVARMTAAIYPELTRGVAILAGSPGRAPVDGPVIPPDVLESVYQSGNLDLPESERLRHLEKAFFAPGNDASVWLDGWHPDIKAAQKQAWLSTPVDEYFSAGTAPVLDLQAENDTVSPRRFAHVLKSELGDRVTVAVIPNAGHALVPEQPAAVSQALAKWARSLYQ